MIGQYSDLILSPRINHRYEVVEPFTTCGVTVPKGYITNGADIPRLFWVFFPPNDSTTMPAVVVHDYLCYLASTKTGYTLADTKFKDVCIEFKVPKFRRVIYYTAISLYTKFLRW